MPGATHLARAGGTDRHVGLNRCVKSSYPRGISGKPRTDDNPIAFANVAHESVALGSALARSSRTVQRSVMRVSGLTTQTR